jgi:hypothetical protein
LLAVSIFDPTKTFVAVGTVPSWSGPMTGKTRHSCSLFPALELAVTITPYLTRLLAEFRVYRIALYFSWVCAEEAGVVRDDMPKDVPTAITRRIVIGQGLYAFGALLGIVSTYLGIAFIIVLVQLNYVVAPRSCSTPNWASSLMISLIREGPNISGKPNSFTLWSTINSL